MPLVHLDLETTGLNATFEKILEVAWTITDDNLRSPWPVPIQSRVISPGLGVWERLRLSHNRTAFEMHTTTGLIDDLKNPDLTAPLQEVEREILGDLYEYEGDGPRQDWHLAGASVHFDLGFLKTWMPTLAERLHHRVYDTSTLRAFFSSLNIDHGVVNEKPHRAAHDVNEMLTMARRYRYFTKSLIHQAAWSAGGRGLEAAVKAARSAELEPEPEEDNLGTREL